VPHFIDKISLAPAADVHFDLGGSYDQGILVHEAGLAQALNGWAFLSFGRAASVTKTPHTTIEMCSASLKSLSSASMLNFVEEVF
jgi:hypothetical protein